MFDHDSSGWDDEVFQPVDPEALENLPSLPEELAWLSRDLTESLEGLCAAPPSAATHRALELIGARPMSTQQRMLYAAAWDRQLAAVTAAAMAAMTDATRPHGTTGWTAEQNLLDTELALLLRRSGQAMGSELWFARRVRTALPVIAGLLAAGAVTPAHVRALAELTEPLPVEDAHTIDASVSDRAASMTVAAFRRIVRRAVAALDPDPAVTGEKARRIAGQRWYPGEHGMGTLALTMSATDGLACLHALNNQATALKFDGDPRSHGQRVVDVAVTALTGAGNVTGTDNAPKSKKKDRGARIVATIDLQTLLGLRDGAGELSGHGPVPAREIRDLLTRPDTTLHRLVYDPVTGNVSDYTVNGYTPDEALVEIVRVRDVTCRFPGCTRNAIYCDTEHCDAYNHDDPDEGGDTSCANCGLACRAHHNLKTHDGYSYTRPDPATGETVWATPAGFTYIQQPATYSSTGPDTGNTLRHPSRKRPPPIPEDPPF